MKRYRGTGGCIGTATHMEKHYLSRKPQDLKRRSRRKCSYYCNISKYCKKLGITCVGPSNALCKEYREQISEKRRNIEIGMLVNSPQHGVGMVMNVYENIFFEVKYYKSNFVKKYSLREIKEILLV